MAVPDIRPRRTPGWYGVRRYRLRCPAGCPVPTVAGSAEAARLLREHPARCSGPGPVYPTGPLGYQRPVHEDIYMEQVA